MNGERFGSSIIIDMKYQSSSDLSLIARRLFADAPFLIRSLQRLRPFICPFDELIARVPVGSSVLDVGCGAGLFLGLLSAMRKISYGRGFDSSPQAINAAQVMAFCARRSRSSFGRLIFDQRNITEPWGNDQFDVVSIIDVMHHVHPAMQRSLLDLAIARIKPGGLLLYKDMVCRPLWRATANRLHDLLLARQWVHYAPIAEIESWATNAGLELVEARAIPRLWYGHELRIFRKVPS
jgi:2-polyprenyl-3-methyl-5-hydroxy-6-metoxy-1,4-benzoquinol methylase